MENEYGIDNLKKAIDTTAEFGEELEDALDDGKISTWEAIGFIDNLKDIAEIVSSWDEIGKEVMDLNKEENAQLIAYAVDTYDLKSDKAERLVESSIKLLLLVAEVIDIFKK